MNATEQAKSERTRGRLVARLIAALAAATRSYAMVGPFCPLFSERKEQT